MDECVIVTDSLQTDFTRFREDVLSGGVRAFWYRLNCNSTACSTES